MTPTAWGVPTASERGAKSEVAHKWAGPPATWGVLSASEQGYTPICSSQYWLFWKGGRRVWRREGSRAPL